ncbi:HlyC/CorC family transporter [Halostella sp. JP-L12]|uniref:hemolysin family protein n=1 Tax=Halostella TaxID=1843185 RepID=UPI000EF7F646|nr:MULTISPECIES: hemolysin family protein [Halostella]NHN48185.1 HlyC/CorC family transporter [Halostella sp. JP-L12]
MTVPLQFGVEVTTRTITIGGSAAVAVLIALSGFFSSTEIAMFSLADHKVEAMVAEGLPNAALVRDLKADPHRLLVTILVGNNVVNIAMASISTTVLALHFPPAESVLISTFGITALVLLFGESAPKSYAVEHTDTWSRRVARPLKLAEYAMYPLIVLFDRLTRVVNRLTGSTAAIETPYVTRTELQRLIETGEREGVIEEQERELLLGIFQFRNRIAKEVMRSRLDVTAVEAEASVAEAIDVCVDEGHDRLPVYEGTLDSVVGVVELPDLIRAHRDGTAATAGEIAEPALHVPETKDVDELLVEMREDRRRVAIVIDEFGTTQGIVTLADIVEEIVGEMLEEAERPAIEMIDDRTARVRGDVNVHEINEELDVSIPEGEEFETIAGFVYGRLGRVPDEGDAVEHEGVRIEVERMDNARVRTLRVTKPESAGTDGTPSAEEEGEQ